MDAGNELHEKIAAITDRYEVSGVSCKDMDSYEWTTIEEGDAKYPVYFTAGYNYNLLKINSVETNDLVSYEVKNTSDQITVTVNTSADRIGYIVVNGVYFPFKHANNPEYGEEEDTDSINLWTDDGMLIMIEIICNTNVKK
ncbi:MAG: hypothetical protein Q4F05_13725 [bacterium]|nr:hypothetical protein [bacterium]